MGINDYAVTVSVPFINGWTVQWKGYSPASIVDVSIVADAPGIIRLVSNDLPTLGSDASLPLVAVCGALSLFITVTVSPFLTDNSVGVYGGFPGVAALAGMDIVGPDAVAAGAAEPAPPVAASSAGGAGGGEDTGGG